MGLKKYPENLKKIVGAIWELPAQPIQPNLSENGLDCLGYLAGSHDFFQIFRIFFKTHFSKNPQTTIALTFLTHIISAIGGVFWLQLAAAN